MQLWRARSELYGAGYDYAERNFRNGQRDDDLRYDGGCARCAGAVEPAFRARLAFGGRGDFPCRNFLFADGSESAALEIGSACGVAGRGCCGWNQLQRRRLRRWWGCDESWHDHGDLHFHCHGDALKWNGADDGDHGQRAIGDRLSFDFAVAVLTCVAPAFRRASARFQGARLKAGATKTRRV